MWRTSDNVDNTLTQLQDHLETQSCKATNVTSALTVIYVIRITKSADLAVGTTLHRLLP